MLRLLLILAMAQPPFYGRAEHFALTPAGAGSGWQTRTLAAENLALADGPWQSPAGAFPEPASPSIGLGGLAGAVFTVDGSGGFTMDSGVNPPNTLRSVAMDISTQAVGLPLGSRLAFSFRVLNISATGGVSNNIRLITDTAAMGSNNVTYALPTAGASTVVTGTLTTNAAGAAATQVWFEFAYNPGAGRENLTFSEFFIFIVSPKLSTPFQVKFPVSPAVPFFTFLVLNPLLQDNGIVQIQCLNGGALLSSLRLKFGTAPPSYPGEVYCGPPSDVKAVAVMSPIFGTRTLLSQTPSFICFDWSGSCDTVEMTVLPAPGLAGVTVISNLVLGVLQNYR